jgi:hypothetical protein
MIPYVKLNDDTYTLIVNNKPYHLKRSASFHFKRIIESLETATESELLELLTVIPQQTDVYKLYATDDYSLWVVDLYSVTGCKNSVMQSKDDIPENKYPPLVGIFPTIDDIKYDYPEIFL